MAQNQSCPCGIVGRRQKKHSTPTIHVNVCNEDTEIVRVQILVDAAKCNKIKVVPFRLVPHSNSSSFLRSGTAAPTWGCTPIGLVIPLVHRNDQPQVGVCACDKLGDSLMVYNTKNFGAVFFIFSKVTSPPAADVSSTRGAVALQLLRHRAQEFCFGDVTFVKLRQ